MTLIGGADVTDRGRFHTDSTQNAGASRDNLRHPGQSTYARMPMKTQNDAMTTETPPCPPSTGIRINSNSRSLIGPRKVRMFHGQRAGCSEMRISDRRLARRRPAQPELQGLNDGRILGITQIGGWGSESPASDLAFGAAWEHVPLAQGMAICPLFEVCQRSQNACLKLRYRLHANGLQCF